METKETIPPLGTLRKEFDGVVVAVTWSEPHCAPTQRMLLEHHHEQHRPPKLETKDIPHPQKDKRAGEERTLR